MSNKKKGNKLILRYGIAEMFGHDFSKLPAQKIRTLANSPLKTEPCPFRERGFMCNKLGGVCSLRQFYKKDDIVVPLDKSSPVATCPNRFYDSGKILSWVGTTLLGSNNPIVLKELPFLKAPSDSDASKLSTVGKIDLILVHPNTQTLQWCALEIQAVYFSGVAMSKDFALMKKWQGKGIPFPQGFRHPDFRSSGPKRLMPQLQIKVPTISRWGKKMAVVIDLPFWESLGKISEVDHVSNCDIAWFVMKYRHDGKRFQMEPAGLHLTTLDRAVEGLTGGQPTSLSEFEKTLRLKLSNA